MHNGFGNFSYLKHISFIKSVHQNSYVLFVRLLLHIFSEQSGMLIKNDVVLWKLLTSIYWVRHSSFEYIWDIEAYQIDWCLSSMNIDIYVGAIYMFNETRLDAGLVWPIAKMARRNDQFIKFSYMDVWCAVWKMVKS